MLGTTHKPAQNAAGAVRAVIRAGLLAPLGPAGEVRHHSRMARVPAGLIDARRRTGEGLAGVLDMALQHADEPPGLLSHPSPPQCPHSLRQQKLPFGTPAVQFFEWNCDATLFRVSRTSARRCVGSGGGAQPGGYTQGGGPSEVLQVLRIDPPQQFWGPPGLASQ
eukprot:CAMPEP_0179219788 /NCGR_PEP_ID=MMETSP0797-20121207/5232_1 /TAXON_ID=47934 /ORGANISM="Dinophysis acuminata, Strain DAEP01" /LENGTH=164 /DNA_ID=CAMNT_0020926303 /DNA_START=102 /DNA_END=594 /DNA_ORIENTATION=-